MFKRVEAMFLAELLNIASMNMPKDDVWFKCTDKLLHRLSFWTAHEIKTYLKALAVKEVIETRVIGQKRRRIVRINIDKLEEMIQNYLKEKEAFKSPPSQKSNFNICKQRDSYLSIYKRNSLQKVLRNTRLPASPDSRGVGTNHKTNQTEEMMPLFKEIARAQENNKEGKFDYQFAVELRKALVAKKTLTYQWSVKKWAREFRLLRKVVPVYEIQSVLDWYCERLVSEQTKGLPTALCNSKQFRANWNWIKTAYDKWQKRNPQIEISAEAKQIVQTLMMSQWPKGSSAQLPAAVQVAINAFRTFRRKLADYLGAHPVVTTEKKKVTYDQNAVVVRNVYDSLPAATSFAEQWFRQLHASLVNWQEWSGDLTPFVWSGDPTDQKFTKFVTNLISGYGPYTVNLWLKLAKEFK